jgi:hypothetical protein
MFPLGLGIVGSCHNCLAHAGWLIVSLRVEGFLSLPWNLPSRPLLFCCSALPAGMDTPLSRPSHYDTVGSEREGDNATPPMPMHLRGAICLGGLDQRQGPWVITGS